MHFNFLLDIIIYICATYSNLIYICGCLKNFNINFSILLFDAVYNVVIQIWFILQCDMSRSTFVLM